MNWVMSSPSSKRRSSSSLLMLILLLQTLQAIHVRTTSLSSMLEPTQHDIFGDVERVGKLERLDLAIDQLRRRFGNKCVHRAVELTDEVMSGLDIKRDNTVHP